MIPIPKRADDQQPSSHVETRLFWISRPLPLLSILLVSLLTRRSRSLNRITQEIPIAIDAAGPESYVEFTMTEETVISGGMNSPDEDLSILIADASMPIAIVGMGFRGPGEARDINELWETILEKKEAWTPIPAARWNNKAFYHPDHARHGTINVEGGHFLDEDVSLFDAPFFNMTSDEAAVCMGLVRRMHCD